MNEHEAETFRAETKKDDVLQAVMAVVRSGWPADKRNLTPAVAMYYDSRDELVVQDGLLFRGDGLVIPKTLRKRVLPAPHSSHQGIESTLRRARETIYWPKTKRDVKDFTPSAKPVLHLARDSRRRRLSAMTFQIALGRKFQQTCLNWTTRVTW